ncbi:hypothetical protein [Bacillus sp. PK3_68]|uniref:hypothetical protein n=1 Tax=Bacillus sp. PK3_68 TaxID=2027408 RepID=UPI000E72E415|nr:hypothetical protein [Bacillus sp. PK3_68]RJS60680.1 hypothetical protein CJ483_11850 [Bacillus sp. PK3_68]
MRKFVKLALAAFLILAIGAGAAIYYFMKVKQYDVADRKVDEITEKQYSIQLPNGTPLPEGIKTDEDGSVWIDKNGHYILEDGSTVDPQSWMTKDRPANNGKRPNETVKKATVEEIKKRYAPTFSHLERQAKQQLGALVGQAKNEYSEKAAKGEKINPAYFYQKYTGAADTVEAKTDAAFNTVYLTLENELKSNHYSASHAKSFKISYENAKKQQKEALLSKVAGQS